MGTKEINIEVALHRTNISCRQSTITRLPGPFMLWKEQGWCSGESAAFHQCGPGSIPTQCLGLSLLLVVTLLKGFLSWFSFPPSRKTNIAKFQFNQGTIMHKSLRTNLHFWRFCTHARQHYPYNVESYCLQLLLIFNIVLDGKGNGNAFLKGKQRFFKLHGY